MATMDRPRWTRACALALALALACAAPGIARAQGTPTSGETASAAGAAATDDDDDAPLGGIYARVIVERADMRSGPGPSYRHVWTAHRGDVFPIAERGPSGYWYRVELPDGTQAWIQGAAVYAHELSDHEATEGRFAPEVFAPPPLPQATGELAFSFAALGLVNGFMAVRPAFYIAPEFGIELGGGASVGEGGRLLLATGGAIFNAFPASVVVPFVVGGGGAAFSDPNADTFLLRSGVTGALYAGGGLRFCFRYHITIRIEARAWVFYDENRYVPQEEYGGGLTVFF